MCVVFNPAQMERTIGLVYRNVVGATVRHTVVYQNTVKGGGAGQNCLIIHLPTEVIRREDVLDLSGCKGILKLLVEKATPASRGTFSPKGAEVFQSGNYYVVVAKDINDVPEALKQVPRAFRPKVNRKVLKFYEETFQGGGVFVLACFAGTETFEADPFGVTFTPWHSDVLTFPAIDAHDGLAPRLSQRVKRDHTILLGTDDWLHRSDRVVEVAYGDYDREVLPEAYRKLFPTRIIKHDVVGVGTNGDLIFDPFNPERKPQVGIVKKRGYEVLL